MGVSWLLIWVVALGRQDCVLYTAKPMSVEAIPDPTCARETRTALVVGMVNLYQMDFCDCPAPNMAGAKVSPGSTVAGLMSMVAEVKLPTPNPPPEMTTGLAEEQASFCA